MGGYKRGDIVLFSAKNCQQLFEIGLIGSVEWNGVNQWKEHEETGAEVGSKYPTYKVWYLLNFHHVTHAILKDKEIIMVLDSVEFSAEWDAPRLLTEAHKSAESQENFLQSKSC